jgi:hypothetical protein
VRVSKPPAVELENANKMSDRAVGSDRGLGWVLPSS